MLVNLFTMVEPAEEAGFLDAFKAAAEVITKQPGFISMQLHRAIGDSPTYLNYVMWESTEAVRAASLIAISSRNFQHIRHRSNLKAEPRRGVSVAALSADEAWEVSQLRALVECQALRWAIPNMVRADFIQCEEVLDALDGASSVDAKISLNARFHAQLYTPARRPKTLELIENLRMNFERYLRFTWEETHHSEQSQAEHRSILELCKIRDTERACDTLRKHILATGDLLVESLNASHRD